MIWHPLAALAAVPGLTDIIIIGFYEDSTMAGFIKDSKREFPNIAIRFVRHASGAVHRSPKLSPRVPSSRHRRRSLPLYV